MEPPTIADLRARGGLKWNYYPDDVVAGWVAEMDFGLAPPIRAALAAAVERGDTGYFYPDLLRRTAEAASGFWSHTLGWKVNPDRVFAAPDVVEGLRRAIAHRTRPGTPVILHTPVYAPFFSMVDRAGREVVQVPGRRDAEGRYDLDIDAIDAAFSDGAGSIVLCNPWNPTGRSFSADEIGRVVEVASAHSARVIADEVHAPLTYAGDTHVAAASLAPETVVTVTSASKAWNIPGLKCAQVVTTNDDDAEFWGGYFVNDKVGVSTFGLVGNAAAYAEGRDWLTETMGKLESNRVLLTDLMAERLPSVGYYRPDATYLAWLDFAVWGRSDPAGDLLDEGRVALTGGAPFGGGGETYARLNFGTTPEILTEMVERISTVLSTQTASSPR